MARELQAQLPYLVVVFGVKSLGLFGSYVRGEAKPSSDLDVLVEFVDGSTFSNFIDLQTHLSNLLSVKIDLVENGHLKPYIGKRILREVVWLQKDGVQLPVTLPRRQVSSKPDGEKNGGTVEPKREYLDYLQDML